MGAWYAVWASGHVPGLRTRPGPSHVRQRSLPHPARRTCPHAPPPRFGDGFYAVGRDRTLRRKGPKLGIFWPLGRSHCNVRANASRRTWRAMSESTSPAIWRGFCSWRPCRAPERHKPLRPTVPQGTPVRRFDADWACPRHL